MQYASALSPALPLEVTHEKRVKRGFRHLSLPITCGVIFEDLPAWLWGLRLAEISKIYLSPQSAQVIQHRFQSTWGHVESKLVIVDDQLLHGKGVDIWLVSGSRSFLASVVLPSQAPILSWLYPVGRRKPSNTPLAQWVTVCHNQVGGTTNISGTFCLRNLPFSGWSQTPYLELLGILSSTRNGPSHVTSRKWPTNLTIV
jgi:hypothetical protein